MLKNVLVVRLANILLSHADHVMCKASPLFPGQ